MNRDRRIAINVTCAAALMLVTSFLTWATVTAKPEANGLGGEILEGLATALGGPFTVELNAFKGTLNLFGVKVPNWLPLFAFAALAVLAWLRALDSARVPRILLFSLLGYAGLHLILVGIVLASSGDARLGIGWFFAIASVVLGFFALLSGAEPSRSDAELHDRASSIG